MVTLLKNDFFEIVSQRIEEDKKDLSAEIRINTAHPVFAGHFPDQPIVPGVFMIQMILEILSEFITEEIHLKELKSVKFLSFVDPTINQNLEVKLDVKQEHPHSYNVTAVITSGAQVFMKCKGLVQQSLPKRI